MMVGNRSVSDFKPQLVMNRRPSNASRHDLPDEEDEVPALPDKTEVHRREELAGRASTAEYLKTGIMRQTVKAMGSAAAGLTLI